MFLTGLMPENKVRTSDKKKKKRKVYLPLHYLSQLWFFERSSWTCNPPKRNDNNSNKKIITMIIMMMMIEVHLYNNLLLLCIYLCRGGYGDWLHPQNYLHGGGSYDAHCWNSQLYGWLIIWFEGDRAPDPGLIPSNLACCTCVHRGRGSRHMRNPCWSCGKYDIPSNCT